MEHFEITFGELFQILGCARLAIKKEIEYDERYAKKYLERDKQTLNTINELEKFIIHSPEDFFKIVEDKPF